jgi:hypothetical protein
VAKKDEEEKDERIEKDENVKKDEKADKSEQFAQLIGQFGALSAVLGFPFYFFVWKPLPWADWVKWVMFGALVAVGAFVLMWRRGRMDRAYYLGRSTIVLLFWVLLLLGAALTITDVERSVFLKAFVILVYATIPASLFIQFIAYRRSALWDEYRLQLFRLEIDHPRNLPPLPRGSIYYDSEFEAAKQRDLAGGAEPGRVYREKFEALFGGVAPRANAAAPSPSATAQGFASQPLFIVLLATMLLALGWILVLQPTPPWPLIETIKGGVRFADPVDAPLDSLRFAFLGAYFYVVQLLVRRYFQSDLKSTAYVSAILRIVITSVLAWAADVALRATGVTDQEVRSTLAFIIGVFPQVGLQVITSVVKKVFQGIVPSLQSRYPLSDLDGINVWYESRLLEEGVEDMQNLATADLVDVMLNTSVPVHRLVDWIDQAVLCLHLEDAPGGPQGSVHSRLRQYGIRTASDLLKAVRGPMQTGVGSSGGQAGAVPSAKALLDAELAVAIRGAGASTAVLSSLVGALLNEPNLRHVLAWKRDQPWEPAMGPDEAPPPPEPPPPPPPPPQNMDPPPAPPPADPPQEPPP